MEDLRKTVENFKCQECGECCIKGVGVALLPDDTRKIKGILKEKNLTWKRFKTFTRIINGMRVINMPCVFYQDRCCQIYQDRPMACRLYPFAIQKDIVRISQNCTYIKNCK